MLRPTAALLVSVLVLSGCGFLPGSSDGTPRSQADCFAGSWSRHVQDEGLLQAGDLDEATLAVLSARDVPGTAFTDPRAHGSGFERTRAFTDGYEGGPKACYPAPAEDWVVRSR